MTDFLSDLSPREFNQLTIFQFEKSDTNLMLKGVHEGPNEQSLSVTSLGIIVAIDIDTYQNSKSSIPNIVEGETASSANNIVGSQ